MSQRNQHVGVEVIIEFKLKVTIDSFSNHNGFYEGQIQQAINEFKESIKEELEYKLAKNYRGEEFLNFVDFVNYRVENMTCKHSKQELHHIRVKSRKKLNCSSKENRIKRLTNKCDDDGFWVQQANH